jgi:hypothetical protein
MELLLWVSLREDCDEKVREETENLNPAMHDRDLLCLAIVMVAILCILEINHDPSTLLQPHNNSPISDRTMQSGEDNGGGSGSANFHEMEDVEFSSIYQKLGTLCTEIEQHILELNGNSEEIRRSVQWMRNESYKETSPEADFLTRLFRRYVDESQAARARAAANGLDGDSRHHLDAGDGSGGRGGSGGVSLVGEMIPQYFYEGTAEQIVGYAALKTNVFWSRVVTGLFALIAFVIMSCVPLIAFKRVSPHMLFDVSLCLSLLDLTLLLPLLKGELSLQRRGRVQGRVF